MNLDLKLTVNSYEGLLAAIVEEADRFFNGRRYSVQRINVKPREDGSYDAEASVYEVTEQPKRSDVPDEKWDPFRNTFGSYAW